MTDGFRRAACRCEASRGAIEHRREGRAGTVERRTWPSKTPTYIPAFPAHRSRPAANASRKRQPRRLRPNQT